MCPSLSVSGSGKSGKLTIVKQMKIIHHNGYKEDLELGIFILVFYICGRFVPYLVCGLVVAIPEKAIPEHDAHLH